MFDDWKRLPEEFVTAKEESFRIIDSLLKHPPKKILDIGCGYAYESELFQKKYNCALYLLDGDSETTVTKERKIGYGDVSNMQFYSKVHDLKDSWVSRKLQYVFVDANKIELPADLKFDLVYSNASCGFHYPLSTYYDLVKDHTDENSILVFDCRDKTIDQQCENLFKILKKIPYGTKASKYLLEIIR